MMQNLMNDATLGKLSASASVISFIFNKEFESERVRQQIYIFLGYIIYMDSFLLLGFLLLALGIITIWIVAFGDPGFVA